jgi:Flp pilus assembly pilin Flp
MIIGKVSGFLNDDSGAAATEYTVLVSVILVTSAVTFSSISQQLSTVLQRILALLQAL